MNAAQWGMQRAIRATFRAVFQLLQGDCVFRESTKSEASSYRGHGGAPAIMRPALN